MRLPRPYIPVDIRLQVAQRQVREKFGFVPEFTTKSKKLQLHGLLHVLGNGQPMELHHRPALCNRQYIRDVNGGIVRYVPDANDPEHLHYVLKTDHDIETRVRGLGAQYSDQALLRKNKRILRNRQPKRKYKWPTRKLRSRGFSSSKSRSRD